jgi:transcriptional regulator with XRE-family HTH domain
MVIGERLQKLRKDRHLSQGDIEKRTGLLRCYVSRVENGHTIPAIETLEKLAHALEVPLYQLFFEGQEPPKLIDTPNGVARNEPAWGDSGRDARVLGAFAGCWGESGKRTAGF